VQRSVVFVVFAAACFALLPVAEAQFRWVCVTTGVTYIVLALASALDAWSRARQ
jgi:hypothetical protein